MKRKEKIDEIKNNRQLLKEWQDIIDSGTMELIIDACSIYRFPYSYDTAEHKDQHIQIERNGGIKGWEKLKHLLTTLPAKIELEEESNQNYEEEEEKNNRFKRFK